MKKSLLALAVLGAYAGVASAQSSVTLYGTVDLNGRLVKNEGASKKWSMGRDGINSSQLGFRGIEDLGGGLKAGFLLLSSVGADSGDIGAGQSAAGSGKFWTRRSTVSLFSNAGELRLGRDYVPTFWNNTIFDAFGTNGLGDSSHVLQMATSTFVRADNSVGYFLPPNIGGWYGQLMGATGEPGQAGQTSNGGRYLGGRVGFAAGPFDVAFAYGQQENVAVVGNTQDTWNIGGAYDFGFLKLLGYYVHDKRDFLKEDRWSISTVIPLGQGEVHLGYERSKLNNDIVPGASFDNSIYQWAATYQYNLSKRTAMYGTYSQLNNGNHSAASVAGGTNISPGTPTIGGNSKGFEIGLRHFF
ncbi:MAG TPA: porin [Caldimonas sp.]